MKVKTMIKGCNFSQYQHMVVVTRGEVGMLPKGGGSPDNIAKRFGDYSVKRVTVCENIVRVEV